MMFQTLLCADIKHARSSEGLVARATRNRKLSLEPRSSRSSEEKPRPLERRKLARAKKDSSQVQNQVQPLARASHSGSTHQTRTPLSLERPTPRSSEDMNPHAGGAGDPPGVGGGPLTIGAAAPLANAPEQPEPDNNEQEMGPWVIPGDILDNIWVIGAQVDRAAIFQDLVGPVPVQPVIGYQAPLANAPEQLAPDNNEQEMGPWVIPGDIPDNIWVIGAQVDRAAIFQDLVGPVPVQPVIGYQDMDPYAGGVSDPPILGAAGGVSASNVAGASDLNADCNLGSDDDSDDEGVPSQGASKRRRVG
ncbi:unnamed protein product [Camellia sinensis]